MYTTVSMNQPPKWSIQPNPHQHQQHQQPQDKDSNPTGENTDDHYSRHLETVPNDDKNDDEDNHDEDIKSADENVNNNNEEEEETKDDEPKVFQVEDVDLPSLITKPNSSKPTSPLINVLKPAENSNFNKPTFISEAVKSSSAQMKTLDTTTPVEINLVSTMATPVHYFSRSSSMTSLNSFDIKSIHSEIASEYSQVTSQVTSPRRKRDEFNHSDYLDDLENLNMPESPSALENSFLMAQRYIHKQQQAIYRQNAAVAMGSLNCDRQQHSHSLQQHSLMINNINLHQFNKIMPITAPPQTFNNTTNNFRILKTTDTNQFNSVYANPIVLENSANLVKPWTSTGQQQTQHHKQQAGNDLHVIMARLNIQKPPPVDTKAIPNTGSDSANRHKKTTNSESSDSDTESDSSDSLSFLKENQKTQQQQITNISSKSKPLQQQQPPLNLITNTPPVKLQATSKFIEPPNGVNNNNILPVDVASKAITQFNVNPVAGMSVSYAFMKNSNQANPTSCLPLSQDMVSNQKSQPLPPQSQYIPNLPYQPKFLQTANQAYFPQTAPNPFNQNPFNQQLPQQPKQIPVNSNISSSSSSSSSQNSVIQQQQLSPTNSDAPYVYMVEKTSNILTPQALKTRPMQSQQHEDRPPSPQESICSRMSDSSIPSIIRQDLNKNTKPQNDFKALFNKLNQQSDINLQKQQAKQQEFLAKANNNLMPAFNFLKSSHTNFGAQPQQQHQSYFSNLNTPTNNNQHQSNMNFSDLDCTYSPKVFQNEGTNSRYDTTDDEDDEEPISDNKCNQNSTAIEAKHLQLDQEDQDDQDDQDELLLENFIKEMLPPANSTTPEKPIRTRMANSISSEAPFTHLVTTKIKSSGSSSSLNSLPVSKPRMNFSRNLEKSVKTTTTPTTKCTPQLNKSSVKSAKSIVPSNCPTNSKKPETAVKKTQPNSVKVVTKLPASAPVVVMTKTAQLRAKMASSNISNQGNNTLNSSINNPVRTVKPKLPSAAHRVPRLKENINTTKTGSSVALNPHLDHLNRNSARRKSFTCGSTTTAAAATTASTVGVKSLKKPNLVADSNKANTTGGSATAKPKAMWK